MEGGTDGTEAANYGGQVLAINKNSQHAEDAFKLITYITKGEFDKKLSEESLGIPSDTTNSEWPVPVSYTHLDVYKRQVQEHINIFSMGR